MDNISIAMLIVDSSQEWARLTSELALYQASLCNVHPTSSVDHPFKFKKDERLSMSRNSGLGNFIPNDPKSGVEFEI